MKTPEQAPQQEFPDIHEAFIDALRNGDAKDVSPNQFTHDVVVREAARGYTATRAHGEAPDVAIGDQNGEYRDANNHAIDVDDLFNGSRTTEDEDTRLDNRDHTEALNAREGKENPTDDDVAYYRWLKNNSGPAEKQEVTEEETPGSKGNTPATPDDPSTPDGRNGSDDNEQGGATVTPQMTYNEAKVAARTVLNHIAQMRFDGGWSEEAEKADFLTYLNIIKGVYGTDNLEDPRIQKALDAASIVVAKIGARLKTTESDLSTQTVRIGKAPTASRNTATVHESGVEERVTPTEKLKIKDAYSFNKPYVKGGHDDDRWFEDRENQAFGVFDGVGGAEQGALGATIARDVVSATLADIPNSGVSRNLMVQLLEESLVQAVLEFEFGNTAKHRGVDASELVTTASVVKVVDDAEGTWLCYALVGDSPLFVAHKDGSYEQIGEEDLENPDQPNAISDALMRGFSGVSNPRNLGFVKLKDGDRVIICSDGITGDWTGQEPGATEAGKFNEKLSDQEFRNAFGAATVKELVHRMFGYSKKLDDKTVVAFEVGNENIDAPARRERSASVAAKAVSTTLTTTPQPRLRTRRLSFDEGETMIVDADDEDKALRDDATVTRPLTPTPMPLDTTSVTRRTSRTMSPTPAPRMRSRTL